MRLRIFTEPQLGASYDDLLASARAAEAGGFDAWFRSDHFINFGPGDGQPGPTDAWVTLAGLARDTTRIRLGTLVTPVTFRLPGPLAISVAQIDVMSGGRVELGLGAGWNEAEHKAYGIPFPPVADRFAILEEQLGVIRGLWTADSTFSFTGSHYQITDSPALPKPLQRPHPPIVMGGWGARRTPRLAAAYADEFNVPFGRPQDAAKQFGVLRAACEAAGRDPATLRLSAAVTICCGANAADLARRAETIGQGLERLRERAVAGTPDEVIERLADFSKAGAETVYLQTLDVRDVEHVELLGERVRPALDSL